MADIKPWLNALGFDENNELTIKGNTISVDLETTEKNIKYPELKEVGRNTTTNLSNPENFVVLEAIIGLLKQGYQSKQISIEKGYKLGHDTKSGNADITVDDNEGNPFLIIEAKTYGDEFEKEWSSTIRDGGQLFSYDKQENKAQVLVLYASRISSEAIERVYHAINLNDNENFLSTLDNSRGYKDAKGGNDKFEIWRDTYQQDYVTNGVLEENIKPFTFGKPKSSTNDLKEIANDEVQKYNQFATILRKYNVGGRENAFDKLVNLFLAKIVDE
ncbi:type I restriction enzyme HsdR N-terminal domain-containing protein [Levilactobacillus brevis]|nr:type I restriction enzyme HsdR N-terminal domain-containing protein [Levilactobacillus brevis]